MPNRLVLDANRAGLAGSKALDEEALALEEKRWLRSGIFRTQGR